jgi:hypothetical protein
MSKLVDVTWIDSQSMSGWEEISTKTKNAKRTNLTCRTVGILASETKDRISILQSVAYNNDGRVISGTDMIVIPKSAIKKIRKLKHA